MVDGEVKRGGVGLPVAEGGGVVESGVTGEAGQMRAVMVREVKVERRVWSAMLIERSAVVTSCQ